MKQIFTSCRVVAACGLLATLPATGLTAPPSAPGGNPPGLESVEKVIAHSSPQIRQQWSEGLEDMNNLVSIKGSLRFDKEPGEGERYRAVFVVRVRVLDQAIERWPILIFGAALPLDAPGETRAELATTSRPDPNNPKAFLALVRADLQREKPAGSNRWEAQPLSELLAAELPILEKAHCDTQEDGSYLLTLPTQVILEVTRSEDKSQITGLQSKKDPP